MEKMHKESKNKEKVEVEDNNHNDNQSTIAERLLQQCLIPVPVQPLPPSTPTSHSTNSEIKEDVNFVKKETSEGKAYSNNNNDQNTAWFKCKICNKPEQMNRLMYHATIAHNIQDISVASRECGGNLASASTNYTILDKSPLPCHNNNDMFKGSSNNSNPPSLDFQGMEHSTTNATLPLVDEYGRMNNMRGNNSEQHQHNQPSSSASMNSPPWCEGAFPSDLEDVALSPPSSYNGNTLIGVDHGNLNCGFSNIDDMNSSSCSPPSVGDLASLNPQDHFDPDFDVVDEMKFIDCLIQTIEPASDNTTTQQNTPDLNDISLSNNSGMDQGAQDDAASSEEDTKPMVGDSLSISDTGTRCHLQPSTIPNSMKTSQIESQSQVIPPSQPPVMRQYQKLGGLPGGPNAGMYPSASQSCMVIGGPNNNTQNHLSSSLQSQFKFGGHHANTINVSFSSPKVMFPHSQHNSIVLPPPMQTFMPLPSSSASSRINSSSQQSSNHLFCNPSIKSGINPVIPPPNNDFILTKMSTAPSSTSNGK